MASTDGSGNIFRIAQINFEQTINANRFSIEFVGLGEKIKSWTSATSRFSWVKNRYDRIASLARERSPWEAGALLQLALFSSSFPAIVIEHQFLAKFNDGVKMPTKFAEIEDLTVNFWDYVNGSASSIMQTWHSMVGDKKTGAIGFKNDFVLPKAYFYVYGPDAPGYEIGTAAGQVASIPYLQKYVITNLWPKQVNMGEHSSESADARKIEVVFAIDNVYPVQINGYNVENHAYDVSTEITTGYLKNDQDVNPTQG